MTDTQRRPEMKTTTKNTLSAILVGAAIVGLLAVGFWAWLPCAAVAAGMQLSK